MKKYLYMALAAAAVLVSCKKEPTEPVKGNEEIPEYAEGMVPVEFTSNLRQAISTKSTIGALDQWNANQKLFIYGIAREGLNAEATEERDLDLAVVHDDATDTDTYPGILINNVLAEDFDNTAGFDVTKLTHQPITVLRTHNPDEYFYYEEDRRYEFFGYYVDDAVTAVDGVGNPAPTIHNGDNDPFKGISLDLEINGSQDIMLATTDHDDDNEANINPNRLYSAYSSRKGVRPNLVFKHQLSRFNVYVKSGDDAATAAKVTLTTVAVETNNTGTLNIAHKSHVANKPNLVITKKVPSDKDLATGELSAGTFDADKHDVDAPQPFIPIWEDTAVPATGPRGDALTGNQLSDEATVANKYTVQMTTAWQKAGTVLVMPEKDEYMLKLGFKQQGYEGGNLETISYYPINFENIVQPSEDAKGIYDGMADVDLDNVAVAGHAYDVNVIIYGLQEVHIEVTLTPWEQNGSFNMDPDNDYEYKISLGADDAHNKNTPLEVLIGGTHQINAVSTPMDRPAEAGFVYESKDPTVATVDENGLITAVAPGKVRIDVKIPAYDRNNNIGDPKRPEGGYTAMWVYVPKLVLGVTGSKTFNKELADAPFTPAYTVKNDADTPADIDGATLTFASDNEAVATVSDAGEITLVGVGVAHITVNATKEGYGNAEPIVLTVNVVASPHLVIDVTGGLAIAAYPDDANLTPTVAVTDDAATPNAVPAAAIVFGQSDDTNVVEVNTTTGELDFKAAGVAHYTISATAAGYVAAEVTVTVTVNALNQYTVELADVTNVPRIISIGGAGPVDLRTFIASIKEGDNAVTPAVTFAIGGDTPYAKAEIDATDGYSLSFVAAPAEAPVAGETMTIVFTVAANPGNHYAQYDGSFNITVTD